MHSVAKLATLQTPLAIFFPFKNAPKPYLVSENRWYCRMRSCCPRRTHLCLALSLCISSVQPAHTSFSLSLCVCQLGSARTQLSLTLSLCISSVQHAAAKVHCSQSNKILCCLSNFTCKYSRNHSTAIAFMLCVCGFIRRRLDYQDFCED